MVLCAAPHGFRWEWGGSCPCWLGMFGRPGGRLDRSQCQNRPDQSLLFSFAAGGALVSLGSGLFRLLGLLTVHRQKPCTATKALALREQCAPRSKNRPVQSLSNRPPCRPVRLSRAWCWGAGAIIFAPGSAKLSMGGSPSAIRHQAPWTTTSFGVDPSPPLKRKGCNDNNRELMATT